MSDTAAPSSWWSSLFQRRGIARGDIAGGVTAALVLPAIEGSYGLLAFAGLGPDKAAIGFLLGACTAAIACIVTMVAGGRGPMLSGSSAALALLLASLIGWLKADPRFLGADGLPFLPLLLAFTALGVVLAGVMQVMLAKLKLGGLVRYVPYPVHAGYMNGVAVVTVAGMLPHLLGLPLGATAMDWREMNPLAPVVALVALRLALNAPGWTRRIPPYLTGLLVATAAPLLSFITAAGALGPLFEAPRFEGRASGHGTPGRSVQQQVAARHDRSLAAVRGGSGNDVDPADRAGGIDDRRADAHSPQR